MTDTAQTAQAIVYLQTAIGTLTGVVSLMGGVILYLWRELREQYRARAADSANFLAALATLRPELFESHQGHPPPPDLPFPPAPPPRPPPQYQPFPPKRQTRA